jgi:predicted MFS family arabinose efflux permease
MRRPGLGVLGERDFRLLFTGQVVSQFGDSITPVALAFAILDLTGRAADLGYVFAARSLPLVGFLLIGGVFADRLPRRAVMIAADLIRLGTQSTTAVLLISGNARIWEIAVLQALHGMATAFFNPAATGLTPQVVSPERLQDANGLRGLSMSASGIAGPAISAALVAGVGPGWALGTDSLTFLISAICLAQLHLPTRVKLAPQSFLSDLRDGWTEFSSRTWVWVIVVCAAVGNGFSGTFFVLGAAISKADLGGPSAWALILASFSVGGLIGGLAVMRIKPHRPLLAACIAVVPWSFPPAMLALASPLLAIAAVSLVSGAGLMFFNSLWETTLQRQIPDAALSRVSAYDWFGSLLMQPLGFALVGPAVVLFGQTRWLWIAFASQLISCLLMFIPASVRRLTTNDSPTNPADQPAPAPAA